MTPTESARLAAALSVIVASTLDSINAPVYAKVWEWGRKNGKSHNEVIAQTISVQVCDYLDRSQALKEMLADAVEREVRARAERN